MIRHKGLIGNFLLIDKLEGKNILDMDKIKLEGKADKLIHLASFCKIPKIN
ncbi:MAG: hypothetical protein Q7S27_02255 [Nanoarchaeota archaeon]|nr:hypothetical protein [Nanoarchaeota archaeon]